MYLNITKPIDIKVYIRYEKAVTTKKCIQYKQFKLYNKYIHYQPIKWQIQRHRIKQLTLQGSSIRWLV